MNYREDRHGNKLSILGFGCMRFAQTAGKIDLEKAEKQILAAYENGVNYYDTAYVYPGSEAAVGEILSRNHIRDKVYIATKLPHYLVRSRDSLEKYFQEQLRRLKTDHIDYYLMHMLTDINAWKRLIEYGVLEWLEEKKKSGAIRQVGFSYHGNTEMFIQLIDAYDWDFCQIQYNYMDEHSQAGRRGLLYAHEKGLPVIIMEPLRGGKLVKNLPRKAQELFRRYAAKYGEADPMLNASPAAWAFRWLWDQPQVTVVLSGMNTEEMVIENVEEASKARPGMLTKRDRAMLTRVVQYINEKMKVGCTGCAYCMPCPHGVDIPGTFAAYNRYYTEGRISGWKDYFMCTALRQTATGASNCIGCGRCEKHCPQHIEIRKELQEARKTLEGPAYKIARRAVRTFRKY